MELSEMTKEELWKLFPITLEEHNPLWSDWYEQQETDLRDLLGEDMSRIDHIGSTAVRGLVAKPIVDILLQIPPSADRELVKSKLTGDGWLVMAEDTEAGSMDLNKGYTPRGYAQRVFHLHVRPVGDHDEIHFRNYITMHPMQADEYVRLKRQLMLMYQYDRDAYTQGKSEFIRAVVLKARSRPLEFCEIPPADNLIMERFLYLAIFQPPGMKTLPFSVVYKPEISIYMDQFGQKTNDHGFYAKWDGVVIAAAWTRTIQGYGHVDAKTPELSVSVLPEYRGKGIGSLLLSYLFNQLRIMGYRQVSLSVQKENPAQHLYRRLGFRVVKENENDLIMVKQLGVHLRHWNDEDVQDLVKAISNRKILDNLRDGIPYPYTEKDAQEFIRKAQDAEMGSQFYYAIAYDGRTVGSIGVFRQDNVHRLTAELGYYLAEPYWGMGIMTEAIRQICTHVFENTDINRIFASPYATNAGSCRVLEKAGFELEGTLRQNAVKNGKMVDMKMYALLKPPHSDGEVNMDIK